MAFEIGKTSSGAKYVIGNNGNTVYLSQAGIKIKNELIAGANKYVVYVLNVTDVIYSGPLDSLLYNGGSISSDPKVAIDFLVSEGWVNFKPGSSGGGGTFDPSAYDLAAFKNQSPDPFAQESDLLNKADLVGGKVPASQLPSYVDDVIEGVNLAAFPVPGESGKIYLALDTNKIYRWSGSAYIDMTPGEADTLQTVTTRNPVTTNTITVAGIKATALQGDSTYTKQIIAKPDGTFGWEDKTSLTTAGGVIPSIKIIDYTQDATNYILRVSYTYGQAAPSLPLFEVRIHSAQLLAQNITTQTDGLNQTTSTLSNVIKNGFVTSILIPKASNASPIWNNDIAGVMVTLLGVDNGDGGASSTKIVRRVVSDMDFIGNMRPKQTLLTSGTNIKTINGTSLLGSGDILTNPISTILLTNSGASLGALNTNTTVDINLNTSSTWVVNTLASKTGATVSELISAAGNILDTSDKNLNIFRIVLEVSYAGGGADGTLEASIVNPSGVVIDQDIKGINIDGVAATNQRLSFRFFAVKTSDNTAGYTLRLRSGAKSLTAYRIVNILRNNNN